MLYYNALLSLQLARTYLLYAAVKAAMDVGQPRHRVEVSMSAEEEVKVEGELGEGAPRRAQYDWLIIHLQASAPTLSRETHRVPCE